MTASVVDALARPRVGIVLPGDEDRWTAAIAARTLSLAVLRRLPRGRVEVLTAGAGADAMAGHSPLDCGRPARPLARGGADRRRCDVLLAVGGAAVGGGRSSRSGASCAVVQLPGRAVDVATFSARAAGDELRRNRLATMRLLGWLPPEGTAYIVVDDPGAAGVERIALRGDAGVDEMVAAIAGGTGYAGSHPAFAAVAAGASGASESARALDDALDTAAAAAGECWTSRGSPGAVPDPEPGRRAGAQHASLRIEIRRLEHELIALPLHVNHLQTELDRVVSSRTWRYTESARGMYRAARRRLNR